ncbi:hypothetical protein BDZ97DRAFT_1274369 [Flammula alnicola]|nr:hypothetical protein BDZ97DRAFT_1274369 [Flammula alnicola]
MWRPLPTLTSLTNRTDQCSLASPNLKAWLCVTKGKSSYSDKGYEVGTTRESKNIQLLWRLVKEPPKPVQPAPKKPVPPPKKPAPPPKKPAPPPKKPAPPPKEDSDSDIPSDEVDSDEEYGPKRPTRASSSSSDEEFGPKRPGTHTKASGAGPSMTGASQYGPSVPKPNYFGGGPKVTPASNSGPSIPQPDPSLLDKGPNPKPAAKKAPGVKKKPTGSNAKGKKKRKHGLNSKG